MAQCRSEILQLLKNSERSLTSPLCFCWRNVPASDALQLAKTRTRVLPMNPYRSYSFESLNSSTDKFIDCTYLGLMTASTCLAWTPAFNLKLCYNAAWARSHDVNLKAESDCQICCSYHCSSLTGLQLWNPQAVALFGCLAAEPELRLRWCWIAMEKDSKQRELHRIIVGLQVSKHHNPQSIIRSQFNLYGVRKKSGGIPGLCFKWETWIGEIQLQVV